MKQWAQNHGSGWVDGDLDDCVPQCCMHAYQLTPLKSPASVDHVDTVTGFYRTLPLRLIIKYKDSGFARSLRAVVTSRASVGI